MSNKVTTFVGHGVMLLACATMVCACGLLGNERGRDIVAECCGQTLTMEQITQMPKGYSGADSARIAEEYIQDWAYYFFILSFYKSDQNGNAQSGQGIR